MTTNAKHTQWTARTFPNGFTRISDDLGNTIIETGDYGAKEYAKLLAAAPDLLAALQDCVEALRDTAARDGGALYQKANAAYEQARAAIAKATA